jgi:hypothetical protein
MTTLAEQLIAQALALPKTDRLAVATAPWNSLKGQSDALNEDVADFVSLARAHELHQGAVQRLGHKEVFEGARSALK